MYFCDFVVIKIPNSWTSVVIVQIWRGYEFCSSLLIGYSSFTHNYILPEILTKRPMDKRSEVVRDSEDFQKWCLCNEPLYGKMFYCDREQGSIGWFQYTCINMRCKFTSGCVQDVSSRFVLLLPLYQQENIVYKQKRNDCFFRKYNTCNWYIIVFSQYNITWKVICLSNQELDGSKIS